MYERISALLPENIRNWIIKEIQYSGLKITPKKFIGSLIIQSISIAIIAFLICFFILKFEFINSMGAFLIALVGVLAINIFSISNIADSRGQTVEKILPDALQLIASNIKAGLTTERSLFVSARPEFGALSEELKETSKRIVVGDRLEKALLRIPTRIKSKVLERTIWLITEGIKSGGQIANLLVQLSVDLREENALKAEVNSNTSMYVMLIFMSAAFGAPMLFGISSYIVGVLSDQTSKINIDQEMITSYSSKNPALSLIGIPSSNISEEFIVLFSMIVLLTTSIFASMIIGVINSGSEKAGTKFILPLLAISFIMFFAVRFFVKLFFGGMIV